VTRIGVVVVLAVSLVAGWQLIGVTITLSGGCAPPPVVAIMCAPETGESKAESSDPYEPITLVPVTLATPLGARTVVDGATGKDAIAAA
jgi:hypothetical protein